MKYLHLIWAALFRRKTRTILTLVSIIAAFLLFGMLDAVRTGFDQAGNSANGAERLQTGSRLSFIQTLPQSLEARIAQVPGVKMVTYANWFGGAYQDPHNQVFSFAVEPNYLDLYPEMEVSPAERKAFDTTRTGALVGEKLAERFHWKVGDKIPMQSTIFPNHEGSKNWTFDIVGILHSKDKKSGGFYDQMFLLNWKYFDETTPYNRGQVGWYVTRVTDVNQADRVAKAIDAISANSDHETRTQTEAAATASWMKQLADIGLIVTSIMGAVFFTLLLLSGNTMMQAVRERTSELAVLKTTRLLQPQRAGDGAGRVGAAAVARRGTGPGSGDADGWRYPVGDGWRDTDGPGGCRHLAARFAVDDRRRPAGRCFACHARDASEHRRRTGRALRRTTMFLHSLMLLFSALTVLSVVLLAVWMLLARQGRQAISVTAVGISTLRQRLGMSSVIVIGIAGVVAVLVALLAMSDGYRETLSKTGSADTAIVMRGASASEVMSVLDHDSVTLIPQTAGIAKDAKGQPIASPELVVAANLPIKGGAADDEGSVQLRGVGDQAWAVRPNLKIVEGRKFTPGMRELIVGKGAARQFAGLEPGHEIRLGSQLWTVVGVFASGDSMDSEVWGDAGVVADTYRRGSSRASVTVKLADPARIRRLQGHAGSESATEGGRQHHARLFQQAVRRHEHLPDHHRHRGRLDHGDRRDLRRAQLHVRRGRGTCARDRHACGRSVFADCRWWSR